MLNCSPAGKLTFKEFYNSLKNTLELKDLPDDDFEEEQIVVCHIYLTKNNVNQTNENKFTTHKETKIRNRLGARDGDTKGGGGVGVVIWYAAAQKRTS